jgi:hypothetical protein
MIRKPDPVSTSDLAAALRRCGSVRGTAFLRPAAAFAAALAALTCGTSCTPRASTGCTAWNAIGTLTLSTDSLDLKVGSSWTVGDVLTISSAPGALSSIPGAFEGKDILRNGTPVGGSGSSNNGGTVTYTIGAGDTSSAFGYLLVSLPVSFSFVCTPATGPSRSGTAPER